MPEMDNQQVTLFEIGWLAGIIDGEGYLGLRRTKDGRAGRADLIQPQMHIINTDKPIIDRAADIMRRLGINVYCRSGSAYGPNKKPSWRVQIKNLLNIEILLKAVGDNLTGNKKQRSDLILRFIECRKIAPTVYRDVPIRRNSGGKIQSFTVNRPCRPYTIEELSILEACKPLMKRGSSETTREAPL